MKLFPCKKIISILKCRWSDFKNNAYLCTQYNINSNIKCLEFHRKLILVEVSQDTNLKRLPYDYHLNE